MEEEAYSREEVIAAGDSFPERGLVCHRCETKIPQFRELSAHDEIRVRLLIRNGRHLMAMEELKAATGCSLRWAKIWVVHEGIPKPLENEVTPCPYCGMPLRTSLAKQCRHCFRQWHDS